MKKIIKEEICIKYFNDQFAEIHFSDLPKDIREDDIIDIRREKPVYTNDNSFDGYAELYVMRRREETDKEQYERLLYEEKKERIMKQRRYEDYIRLKKEFEESTEGYFKEK